MVPVTGLADAIERVQWYVRRWGIEVFHRILKSGCQIEDRQFGTADRLEACLVLGVLRSAKPIPVPQPPRSDSLRSY